MLKLQIQFNGSGYFGWQIQKNEQKTIQQKVNEALYLIYKNQVKTQGSGRTDAGVHALNYYVVFEEPFPIRPLSNLVKAINTKLPTSIRALSCEVVESQFSPTAMAKSKEYRYFFSNLKIPSPFSEHLMSNISYSLDEKLMHEACALFVGRYDFLSFHCTGSDPKSTIREVFECEIFKEEMSMGGVIPEHYVIRITGNGFLKQMVRSIVGTIWAVGKKKVTLKEVREQLVNPTGKHIAPVAPAVGLVKFSVNY
jgi:tRNA pseudouridine38-40 synthase